MSISFPFDGVQGCATHDNSLAIGVGHPSGVQCSSHGSCVSGLCVCSAGWTGVSDMYDLDGLDCQVPRVLEQVMWAITGIAWLVCAVHHIKALIYQHEIWSRKSKANRPVWYKYIPFRFLLRSSLTIPFMLAAAALKATTETSIGRDALVTICYAFAAEMQMWIVVESQTKAFKALFNTLGSTTRMKKLLRNFRIYYYSISGITLTVRVWVTFAGVFWPNQTIDKMHSLVITRNIASIFYFAATGVVMHHIASAAESLIVSMAPASSAGAGGMKRQVSVGVSSPTTSSGKTPSKRKVQRVIEELHASSSGTIKRTVLAVALYATFTTPHLYGFQGLLMSLLMTLGTSKTSHNVFWYTRSSAKKDVVGAVQNTSQNAQVESAKSTTEDRTATGTLKASPDEPQSSYGSAVCEVDAGATLSEMRL